jgi:hypothetical protein
MDIERLVYRWHVYRFEHKVVCYQNMYSRVAVSEHVVQSPISLMMERTLWIDCRVSVKRTIEFERGETRKTK